jgi:multidrug resistance protein MdtO
LAQRSAALWAALHGGLQRGGFALRLALICALTAALALHFQAPEAALSVYVVLFMNKPDRASSLLGSVALVGVITLVVGLMVLICGLVLDHPAWRVATMAGISLLLLWLVSASKLRPVGGTLTLVLAYAMDLLGSIPTGEVATRGFLYAWQLVAIPAGASIVVNLLLAPTPRSLLQSALAQRLRSAAAALAGDVKAAQRLQDYLRAGLSECRLWLQRMSLEHSVPAKDLAALHAANEATFALLSSVDLTLSNPAANLPGSVRSSLGQRLTQMADIFAAGAYPVEIEAVAAGDAPLSELAATVLADINASLLGFAVAPQVAPAAPARASGFFLPDAFSNPEHSRYALKTTAAAMFCYLLYSLLNWPGIHTCMLTCYIVSLSNLAESVEKLVLRLVGCLIGAALGLAAMVWVVPQLTSLPPYLALIFAGALLSAWVAVGSERIAYAGFQMALAFFMCVIQGAGPGFDMVLARDRIIGILLGNAVVYVVATRFWPVSVRGKIESGMDACLAALRQMLGAADVSTRRQLAASVQTLADAVQADLERANYEPPTLRPSLAWLNQRRQIASRMASLTAPLLLPPGAAQLAVVERQLEELHGLWAELEPSREVAHAPT